MKMGGSFEQCYNAQAVVDGESQLIVANGLTNNAADNGELIPMVEAVKDNLEGRGDPDAFCEKLMTTDGVLTTTESPTPTESTKS